MSACTRIMLEVIGDFDWHVVMRFGDPESCDEAWAFWLIQFPPSPTLNFALNPKP